MIRLCYYFINYLFQMVFTLRFDVKMRRIADVFIVVFVMIVPLSRSNDCGLSTVYNADNAQYVIDCGSLNLTAVPSGIDTTVTE